MDFLSIQEIWENPKVKFWLSIAVLSIVGMILKDLGFKKIGWFLENIWKFVLIIIFILMFILVTITLTSG